jgi:flagellar basal body rod protein FlgG
MDNTITGISRALHRDIRELDVISQNVANMQTPGYRAERLAPGFTPGAPPRVVLASSDGPLQRTGQPLDVAVRGNAFFVVDVDGQTLLTRAGAFHVNVEGVLVNASGHPVLGEAGPISIPSGKQIRILSDGAVQADGHVIDQLQMVAIGEPQALQAVGDGLYSYTGPESPWNGQLAIGALEQADVDPGTEMVRLIAVTRHAQSLQQALRAYDEALQTGINHLGENS